MSSTSEKALDSVFDRITQGAKERSIGTVVFDAARTKITDGTEFEVLSCFPRDKKPADKVFRSVCVWQSGNEFPFDVDKTVEFVLRHLAEIEAHP